MALRLTAGLFAGLLTASMALPLAAQELHEFADSSRLVSIGGSLTEIVYALGEEGKLVARDQTALYPEAALALPDVGYMRALAPEGVLSVSPTALLVIDGSGPPEALEVLSHAGVEYQSVPEAYSHEGILTKVRAVGQALGVTDKAEALVTELDTALKAVEARVAGISERKRVLFVLVGRWRQDPGVGHRHRRRWHPGAGRGDQCHQRVLGLQGADRRGHH